MSSTLVLFSPFVCHCAISKYYLLLLPVCALACVCASLCRHHLHRKSGLYLLSTLTSMSCDSRIRSTSNWCTRYPIPTERVAVCSTAFNQSFHFCVCVFFFGFFLSSVLSQMCTYVLSFGVFSARAGWMILPHSSSLRRHCCARHESITNHPFIQ